MADELLRLLNSEEVRDDVRSELLWVAEMLGEAGAHERAAAAILESIAEADQDEAE
ncbi:MAG: hypothetical protein AAGD22_05760 [Verrucomicrobiota bacterium]